jgi:hypothetical protein
MVGRTKGKGPIGRPRRRWENNIKMDVREEELSIMCWIVLARDRDQWRAPVNTAMNLRVPYNIGKVLSSCTSGGFSSMSQVYGVS